VDLELLRTFLEVHRVHHFGRAAENLFITPSAVSARIRQLEKQTGVVLFNRSRNNIHLTDAGERLLNHAKAIVNAWERARYELLSEADQGVNFSILAVPSLWDTTLLQRVAMLREGHPELLLRLEAVSSETILRRLQQNQADFGFVLEPFTGPELQANECGTLDLVLVSTESGRAQEAVLGDGYIVVDWGSSFATHHTARYPDALLPATRVSNSSIAHGLLLQGAGRGCFLPASMVADDVESGRLFRVEDAAEIRLSIYAVYAVGSSLEPLIGELLGS